MMPGVAAQMLNRRSGGIAPEDTLLTFAPDIGLYSVAGVTVALSDIIDQPGWVTGGQLVIAESATVPALIGAMLAATLVNGTFRIEWDHLDYSGNVLPFVMCDADTFDDALAVKRQDGLGSHFMSVSDFSGPHFRAAYDTGIAIGDGVHTIAMTRTDAKLVFSIDGRAVVQGSDVDPFAIAPTAACFGGYPGDTINAELRIKSFRAYTVQDDGALPALSAI